MELKCKQCGVNFVSEFSKQKFCSQKCYRLNRTSKLIGQRFGLLKVVSVGKTKNRNTYVNCICDCGNSAYIRANSVKYGTRSCGCLQKRWAKSPKNVKRLLKAYLKGMEMERRRLNRPHSMNDQRGYSEWGRRNNQYSYVARVVRTINGQYQKGVDIDDNLYRLKSEQLTLSRLIKHGRQAL